MKNENSQINLPEWERNLQHDFETLKLWNFEKNFESHQNVSAAI